MEDRKWRTGNGRISRSRLAKTRGDSFFFIVIEVSERTHIPFGRSHNLNTRPVQTTAAGCRFNPALPS